MSAFITLSYILSAYIWSCKISRKRDFSLSIILLLVLCLLSVEPLGAFGVFSEFGLSVLGLLFLLGSIFVGKRNWVKINHFKADLGSVLFITCLISIVLFYNEIAPVAEIDSVSYHLPIVSKIISTGSVWEVFHAGFVGPNTFFPANHEALQSFLAIQSETMKSGVWVTLITFLLFVSSLLDLNNKRLPNIYLWILALSAASTPFLFRQFLNFQIDLFMFSLFGASVALLVSSIINEREIDLAKGCLVLGLMLGSKYNALPQVIALAPLFLLLAIFHRNSIRSITRYAILILIPGGFWYFRNWILTENPIYPFGLNLGPLHFIGHKVFTEETGGTSLLTFLQQDGINAIIQHILENSEFSNELGNNPILAVVVSIVLSILVAIGLMIKKGHRNLWTSACILSLLLVLGAETAYYVSSPYTYTLWNQTIRYASPIFALIPILFALSSFYLKKLNWIPVLFAIFILTTNLSTESFLSDPDYLELIKAKLSNENVESQVADDAFLSKKLSAYSALLPHLKMLRELQGSNRETIALSGLTPYWLFEKEGYNPVYINIDGCMACQYFDYRNEPKSIRANPNMERWESAIKNNGIKFLIVDFKSYAPNVIAYEDEWARSNPSMFQLVLRTESISLYAVR